MQTSAVYSDKESRKRALFAMPHIHAHGISSYTDDELDRCTACQQDHEGYLDWNHYVDDDGKIMEVETNRRDHIGST